MLAWNPSDNVERDIAGDLAVARQMGLLASQPGGGLGQRRYPGLRHRLPHSHARARPRARRPDVPEDPSVHEDALAKYDIPDEELVLSRGLKGGMAVYLGSPQHATQHHDFAFLLGVIGAVMAALCAFALGAILTGTL